MSLDDYFCPGSPVDFIKIDVQGYEHSVLRGAQRVLKENRGIRVLMEFWPYGLSKAGVAPSDVLNSSRFAGWTSARCRAPGVAVSIPNLWTPAT